MRIRTIKPEFFLHEGLYELEKETGLPVRISFAGLWCAADREGRFKWEPRRLGIQILPYDQIDFSRVLDALGTRAFILKYRVDDECFGVIPTFGKHQVINNRERDSELPEPIDYEDIDASATRQPRVTHASKAEGKGREQGRERNGREQEPVSDAWQEVVDGWNAIVQLPSIKVVSPKRKTAIKARLAESFFSANWQAAIFLIPDSPFLMGNNPRGWKADFDWFLQPDSVAKIMEGKYDYSKPSTLEKQTTFDDSYERIQD